MWSKPKPYELIRLRCENPFCRLYYLSPPGDPERLCPQCREEQYKRRAYYFPSQRKKLTPFELKHRKVYNRYDRPLSNRR